MLRLKNIKKVYKSGSNTVEALKGLTLSFRKNEFVSILGPSGCGKTTTLNIIGGLDKYTSGDLFINGVSTKNFKDRDWDVYRNHRIGFIFQSYNLIPHQTILGNVELALTISGVSKHEREAKARAALDKVGLAGQYNKKPNQLSGGQCQRVAIARALVNNPEILLADEPTGALDTNTSIQIMDLIKEISKGCLVIMVTHNPELAEKYSTRIIRLLDGELQSDSKPFSEKDEIEECKKNSTFTGKEKAKMSFWTAFKLSFKNLLSKFNRTLLVSIAGSIGIVGVSTVLAVSYGVQDYISDMENDMLSGYPVYISSSTIDYTSMMSGSSSSSSSDTSSVNPDNDTSQAYVNSYISTLYKMNGVTSTNSITKEYMDFLKKMPSDACAVIKYNYGNKIAPNIYTDFKTVDNKTHTMSVSAIQSYYASTLKDVEEFSDYASMISSVTVMSEIPSSASYLASQYDIVYIEDGLTLDDVIKDESSLIGVVSKGRNTLNDLELAEYGYFTQEQFLNYCYKVGHSDLYNDSPLLALPDHISYETLADKKFTWYPNDTVFTKASEDNDFGPQYYASAYSDGTLENEEGDEYDNFRRSAFGTVDGSVDLNVKCVLKLKDELSYGCLTAGGLYYTNALSNHMRKYDYDSDITTDARNNNGELYNIELGYNFRLDGNSKTTFETASLNSSSTSSIMSYISQFLGGGSSTTNMVSYTAAALGGKEYPSSVYFYLNDFAQKEVLCAYLDKWNSNEQHNLYKKDSNGFYVATYDNEKGIAVSDYYYRDSNSGEYFKVNIDSDGFVEDKKGNQYKLVIEDDGAQSFYLRVDDKLGDAFFVDGQVEITDGISINAYNLASYSILGKEFSSNNAYYDSIKPMSEDNDYFYYYEDSSGETNYLMKTKNQVYYPVTLDKDGMLVSANNGYNKYRYDEEEDTFYLDSYVASSSGSTYTLESTAVEKEDQSSLYSSSTASINANVSKNPTYTINIGLSNIDGEYTLDTKGYYIDATSLVNIVTNTDLTSLNNNSAISIDTTEKIITINDYSKFNFYYRDLSESEYAYHYVEIDDNGYLVAKDISTYLSSYNLSSYNVDEYISDKYFINDDGSLRALSQDFEEDPLTITQILDKDILGDQLDDLSKLDFDDSKKITYTDTIGLIIGMVNDLINIVTYSLVAFTALSLVVSTVMIGIITYVSVVERIKEIGVIRSLGGRKKDVRHLFNAETFIIGLSSGLIGIGITYALSLLLNTIVGNLTGIYTIAQLPWHYAAIMVLLSVILTMISGLIPASSAAHKDPVNALRSE